MRRTLRSRKFWVGALAGIVVGPWVMRKTGVSLPKFGG